MGKFDSGTLASDQAEDILLHEICSIRIDITAINETMREAKLATKWRDGSPILLGVAKRGVESVGFIVRSQATSTSSPTRANLSFLVLVDKKSFIKITSVPSAANNEDFEPFEGGLDAVLQKRRRKYLSTEASMLKYDKGKNRTRYWWTLRSWSER